MTWLDWLVVWLYLSAVAGGGLWFARRQKSTEDYFIGGRSIPGWAAGISLFGSSISTATFLAYPGHGFSGDWTRLLPGFMLPVVAVPLTFIIIPLYRRTVRMSAYEFLEHRFGYGARAYAAILYFLLRLFRMGFILFLAAKALSAMTGWDIRSIIVIGGIITIAYTMLGGIKAVIWTDVAQTVVLMGGGLLCAAILLLAADSSPGALIAVAHDADKFRLAELSLDLTRPTIVVAILFGLFTYSGDYFTSQDYVQRYLSVSTTREAQRGVWLGVTSCVFTWTLFMFVGTMLFAWYTLSPEWLPAEVAGNPDTVFPWFVMSQLPVGLVGLVVAAMCAAAMSSLDTVMNSMAMVTVYDFHARWRPDISDRRRMILARVAAALWGCVGIGVALSMIRVEAALDFSFVIFSILLGGLVGMFLLAFFVPRAHASGVYVGLAVGILITGWGTLGQIDRAAAAYGLGLPEFLRHIRWPLHEWMLLPCSNAASFVVGYTASLLLPDRRRQPGVAVRREELRIEN